MVDKDLTTVSTKLDQIPRDTIYTTVRCLNGAGLSTTLSSDGFKILNRSLSINEAFVEVITTGNTQYLPIGKYHGDSSTIKFRWNGFKDDEGINNYLVGFRCV